ncbi:hypothetical protein [Pseudomonas fragi]|uniref:hypothetical protein n=1 Tax=Pseudomonas fragi TaxID=296 RepID=UPI0011400CA8|nr:hypothetical protein [Pseudomonas fragi]
MHLIIDSNQLQHPKLREFLKNPKNRAVLTDFSAMEAYKGDTLNSIFKSMSVVSDFPTQVIILKGSAKVCGMSGRQKGLQRRLIDETQTSEFPKFAHDLRKAESGNMHLRRQLLDLGKSATEHLEKMLIDAEQMREVFTILGNEYTKEERAALREQRMYTSSMVDRLARTLLVITDQIFKDAPIVRKRPSFKELPNTLIFRFSLACYVMAITRSARGGMRNMRPDRLRNDLVDMIFVAYGTYFDGIMSDDENVNVMFTETCLILAGLFNAEIPALNRLQNRNTYHINRAHQ